MTETMAALDAGTNTFRVLIARLGPDGRLQEYERQLRFVGLGHQVDATGRFDPAAIQRGWAAIEEFVCLIRRHGCTRARFVATSAARDAANRDEFFAGVRLRLGIDPELISGAQEAQLSFRGALSGARVDDEPVLVMDSGGGSTELVLGNAQAQISTAISLDVGSRRIRERYLSDDPPTGAQLAAATDEINRLLDGAAIPLDQVGTFIGVAGGVTSMAAVHLGLVDYDRARVHGSTMTVDQVIALADRLVSMPVTEVAALGPVAPERAKVLGAGALIIGEVAKRVGRDLQASESDILDGVALSMLVDDLGQRLP